MKVVIGGRFGNADDPAENADRKLPELRQREIIGEISSNHYLQARSVQSPLQPQPERVQDGRSDIVRARRRKYAPERLGLKCDVEKFA
jgi:hypothetical protein